MKICPNCHSQMDDATGFCGVCGSALEQAPTPQPAESSPVYQQPVVIAPPASETTLPPKKSSLWKWLSTAGVALLTIIGIVCVIFLQRNEKIPVAPSEQPKDAEATSVQAGDQIWGYYKDGELWIFNEQGIENGFLVTENYRSDFAMSEDGKYVFYIEDGEEKNLYYREAFAEDSESVKLAKDVYDFWVSTDGTLVTYTTRDDELYQHDLQEKIKLSEDVDEVYVSKDGKKVVFTESIYNGDEFEYSLFIYHADNPSATKIADDIEENHIRFSNDFSAVYYLQGTNYYKVNENNQSELLVDDMIDEGMSPLADDGGFYYLAGGTSVYDCLDTTGLSQDKIEDLKERYLTYQLKYYKDGKTSVICKNCDDVRSAKTTSVVAYHEVDVSKIPRVPYEAFEKNDYWDVFEGAPLRFAVGTQVTNLDLQDVWDVDIAPNGETAYIIANAEYEVDEDGDHDFLYGDMYRVEIDSTVGTPKKLNEKADSGRFIDENYYFYLTNVSDEDIGDLHINDVITAIDSGYTIFDWPSYHPEQKKMLYCIDQQWDENMTSLIGGELHMYDGEKVEVICDNSGVYRLIGDDLYFIADYQDDKGDLYLYGQTDPLVEDVNGLVSYGAQEDDESYVELH